MANNTTIMFPNFLHKYGTLTESENLETIIDFNFVKIVIVISITFTVYYLGFQNRKIYKNYNYYKNLYTDAYKVQRRLEDNIIYLQKKVKSLESRLYTKQRELDSALIITDIDREKIADDFLDIIKTLPLHAKESVTLIQKLANKFDISISFDSSNKKRKNSGFPTRRQPKRKASPAKFFYSDESEDSYE